MPTIYRYRLCKGIQMDTGSLPCPRCRSAHLKRESHPATGCMTTCLDCGARGNTHDWNNGEFSLDREPGKTTYKHNGGLKFERPPSDKIVSTTRERALRLSET